MNKESFFKRFTLWASITTFGISKACPVEYWVPGKRTNWSSEPKNKLKNNNSMQIVVTFVSRLNIILTLLTNTNQWFMQSGFT